MEELVNASETKWESLKDAQLHLLNWIKKKEAGGKYKFLLNVSHFVL